MHDGPFAPEFYRTLAAGQLSASDLARDYPKAMVAPLVLPALLCALVAPRLVPRT